MVNLTSIWQSLGDDIVAEAKLNLKNRKIDKRSSGKLSKSLEAKVVGDKLIIYAEDYGIHVDQGTRDFNGNKFLTDAVNFHIRDIQTVIEDAVIEELKQIIKDKT